MCTLFASTNSIVLSLAALQVCVSCSNDGPTNDTAKLGLDEPAPNDYLIGVQPSEFLCESLIRPEQATELFGGRVEHVGSLHTPPNGVPSSCDYISYAEGRSPLRWSFDLDCRPGAHSDAGQLMAQYASAQAAMPLRIGRSALDHHDSALLFIDDDTPCYGRVLGPGQDIRIRLARLLVPSLTPQSAPTGIQFIPET